MLEPENQKIVAKNGTQGKGLDFNNRVGLPEEGKKRIRKAPA